MLRCILSPITCWWNLVSQSTQLILLRKSWRLPRELVQPQKQLSWRRSSLLQDPQGVGSAHYHFAPAIALQLQPPREGKALCITDTCHCCPGHPERPSNWIGWPTWDVPLPYHRSTGLERDDYIQFLSPLEQLCRIFPIIALPYAYLGLIIVFFPKNTLHCLAPVWQLQQNTGEAAWMNAFEHHINSWKKRLCKYFICTAAGFDLRATSVAVLSLLKAFKYSQIWHVRLIAM